MEKNFSLRRAAGLAVLCLLVACLPALAVPQETERVQGVEVTAWEAGNVVHWQDRRLAAPAPVDPAALLFEVPQDPCGLPLGKSDGPSPDAESAPIPFDDPGRESRLAAGVRSFEGLNLLAHGGGWPPNANGDVGINHYVLVVNDSLGIFSKSTGALLGTARLNDFFPPSCGEPCASNNTGEALVLFDQIQRRWFLVVPSWSGTTNGSSLSVAASQTEDPTGAWWTYCLKADNTLMVSNPRLGVWNDGLYITANLFAFGGAYQQTGIWVVKTPEAYRGNLIFQRLSTLSLRSFGMVPGCARGRVAPLAGTSNFLFTIDANEFGGSHTDALHVWTCRVDWRNPANTALTGPTVLPVDPYDLTASRVPQLGTTWTLDSLYGRLMYPAPIRFGGIAGTDMHQSVYLCHLVDCIGARAMRWYELRIQGGTVSIYQQGTFAPDANHRWMGSICADVLDNIVLGYNVSSTQMYPAIRFTGRQAQDPRGTLKRGEATIVQGTGAQTRISRWGEVSMMTVDPVDDLTFWYVHEYYLASAVAPELPDWHTRIGVFRIDQVPPAGSLVPEAGLDVALDLPRQPFYNRGIRPFVVSTVDPHAGPSCLAVPESLADSESCRVQTTVSGRNGVRFWWKVSSESGWDYLCLYLDGVLQQRISGAVGWTQVNFALPPGTHTLTWAYIKDASDSAGADCAWLDKVELY